MDICLGSMSVFYVALYHIIYCEALMQRHTGFATNKHIHPINSRSKTTHITATPMWLSYEENGCSHVLSGSQEEQTGQIKLTGLGLVQDHVLRPTTVADPGVVKGSSNSTTIVDPTANLSQHSGAVLHVNTTSILHCNYLWKTNITF
uniref:Secreted protein n=1 Tax=Mesocestoides corti TaxID=53468 RepID=A0A5K3FJP2_MESCO